MRIDAATPAPDASILANDGGREGGGPDAAGGAEPCGFALSLNGTNFASLARSVEGDFTLEAWIRTTDSISALQAFQGRAIFDADVVGGDAPDFVAGVLNDHFALGTGPSDFTVESSSIVNTGAWVHVAGTRAAATGAIQVFVDGLLENIGSSANTAPLDGSPTIALGGSRLIRNFIGTMDEVRIWNRVRTPAQIRDSRFLVLSSNEPGLVGYYRFEEPGGAGGVAEDSSSSNLAATLVGNPSYEPSTALCPRTLSPQ